MGSESDAERQLSLPDDIRISKTSTDPIVMDVTDLAASMSESGQSGSHGSTYVSKCLGVHLGPKFVTVTQNVHKNEGIKEMAFLKYLWVVLKETTKTERIATVAALTALIICIFVVIYTLPLFMNTSGSDIAPHEWNITRKMWLARTVNSSTTTKLSYPVGLIIIQHTVSPECDQFVVCASQLRNLQDYYMDSKKYDDLPYNFQVGNDGRVYEGRGWGVQGAHTAGYNKCSLGIGFIGDYRDDSNMQTKVTPAQIKNVKRLLEYGVTMGFLLPDYKVVGAKDLTPTASPGSNLYDEIRSWPQYDHKKQFYKKSCDEILLMNSTNKTS